MSSNLIVLTFEDMEQAGKARAALRDLQKQGRVSMQDAAVIVKDMDGKVRVEGEASSDSVNGALIGGALGLMLGLVFFPLAGLAIGAGGGALVGHLMDRHVDKKFVKDVEAALKPGNSALFALMGSADPTAALAALRPFKGTVFQTNLDSEFEEQLREALQ